MKLETFYHEDDRRILAEYIQDIPTRTSKAIFIKEDSILGNHYHNYKDDIFFLLKGSGTITLNEITKPFKSGDCMLVKAGTVHSLNLKKGSILLESSTLPYAKEDEHGSL